MSDNEKLANIPWLIGIAGTETPLQVQAAYIYQGAMHNLQNGETPVILKDADHKIVFQGHSQHVQYVTCL
jgi:hypothetical protein